MGDLGKARSRVWIELASNDRRNGYAVLNDRYWQISDPQYARMQFNRWQELEHEAMSKAREWLHGFT